MDAKQCWSTVNKMMNKPKNSFPRNMMIKDKLVSDPQDLATEMNKFFLEKVKKLKEDSPTVDDADSPLKELETYLKNKKFLNPLEFKLEEVNDETMNNIFKRLKGKKSCGPDYICGFSLKLASSVLLPELKHIINISIKSGTFCKEWKRSKIIPIYKNKSSRFDQASYRPVSNLSELSKLCEMAIYEQIYNFFNSNNLFHPDHHGFLKNRNTVTALQQLRDFWMKKVDSGKLCSALLLDLKSGFDVINIKLLISKLKLYRFNENTLKWFESYLTGRS